MIEWIDLGGVRLQLKHFDNGWGWHAWEERAERTWRPLRTPAAENRGRRFRTQEQAARFFQLLAEFMSESAVEPDEGRRSERK